MHDEPLFFILELPVTCDRENPVAPGILEETHKDVYYIDGCSQEDVLYYWKDMENFLSMTA